MSEKKTTEDFITEARMVHGNRYDYSKTVYGNALSKLIVTCREHGDFTTLPNKHLCRNCKKCSSKTRFRKFKKSKLESRFKDIIQPDNFKIIPLSSGELIIVDNEDFGALSKILWYKSSGTSEYIYAFNENFGSLHRYILKAPDYLDVDHINGNTLDNRRKNLRLATKQENKLNSKVRSDSTTGYKCISKNKNGYYCLIQKGKIKYRSKTFITLKECVDHYNEEVIKLHGEFSKLIN